MQRLESRISAFPHFNGMPAQRLLAKLTRPRLHGAVQRERLFARLDNARGCRSAICVVGPPGAGKTTLVASWLDVRAAKGVWYQVDGGDADLATFFHYLGQAAGPYARRGQPSLPTLTPEYLKDVEGFSRRFFRELFARLPEHAVIVLDNYQEVGPEQPFHELIAVAVSEVPPGLILVVISRRDPPDTYARLIANEDVEFVDWDQLKLTLEEAGAIAGERLEISGPEIERLHATSGGWAAGLTLLLEGWRRNGAASVDLPEGRDAIFDYFAAQIFARVPASTQRFLVATALLPQIPVSIARELTNNEAAEAILDDLYRRHLFTHRRSGVEPVYWYHALFRSFLIANADTVLGMAPTQELMSRAARLLEASGAFDDAFELFRDARDWPAATRLIERRAPDLLAYGRGQTLREWIEHLPTDFLESHPWLRYWLGASLVPLDQPKARLHLELAFDRFRDLGDPSGQAVSAAGVIDSYVFEWAEFGPVRRWVDALESLIDRLQLSDSPATEQRVISSLLLGMLYVAPDHPRLPWCVSRVTEMLDEELDVSSKLAASTVLLAYCNLASDRDRASIAVARGNSLVGRPEVTPFSRLWWFIRLGLQFTERGRYDEAIAMLGEAEAIALAYGFDRLSNVVSLLWTYRAITAATQGDVRGTLLACERVYGAAHSGRPMAVSNAAQVRIYSQCAAGHDEALAALGIPCIEVCRATGMIWLEMLARVLHAIGLAATRQRNALSESLRRQRSLVQGTCFVHLEIDMAMVEAWDMLRNEDRALGMRMLTGALEQARITNWQSFTIIHATRMHRELLAEACDAGIEVDFAMELIRRYRMAPPACATDRWPWLVKVRMLGGFEVHVDGALLIFSGKVPKKPLALLKAIIALGTPTASAARLKDALWPDEDGDAARKSLDVTIGRLRKLLGRNDAVVVSDESVSLNPRLCWVDVWMFVREAEAAGKTADRVPAYRLACDRYQGALLPGDLETPWTLMRREQLRRRFIHLVQAVGEDAEQKGDWEDAIAWYLRGMQADELAETFHQGVMRCNLALGRYAEGMSAYRRLRQTLSVVLGIVPSEQSQALARSLQCDGAGRDGVA